MSTEYQLLNIPLPAAADLSSYQYRAVKQDSSGNAALCSVDGEKAMGLLQNDPDAAGKAASIMVQGASKAVAGGTIAYWAAVGTDATGKLITVDEEADAVLGRALESAVTDQVFQVLLTHEGATSEALNPLVNPVYTEAFGYGAGKGLAILQNDGTAYDATADVLNVMHLGGGNRLGAVAIVGQTIPPAMVATGLDVQGDQVDNDGSEIIGGVLGLSGRPFIIGTDAAFYFSCTFSITNADGTDDFHLGFRRAETVNATFDNYLDLVSLGCNTAASPMAIKIETILNNGATTTTDTTDTLAGATSTTWRVNVSAAGVVTYLIDGVAPTATAAFTFDDGDPVIPFFHFLQANAAQTGAFVISNWEVGYQ
jgi:hypothetical protein